MKIVKVFLLVMLFCSCHPNEHEIVGKWKFVRTFVNGKLSDKDRFRRDASMVIEFLPGGEVIYLNNGSRYGIGKYRYEISGDSMLWINEYKERDSLVIHSHWQKFLVKNDILKIKQDEVLYYLLRMKQP